MGNLYIGRLYVYTDGNKKGKHSVSRSSAELQSQGLCDYSSLICETHPLPYKLSAGTRAQNPPLRPGGLSDFTDGGSKDEARSQHPVFLFTSDGAPTASGPAFPFLPFPIPCFLHHSLPFTSGSSSLQVRESKGSVGKR